MAWLHSSEGQQARTTARLNRSTRPLLTVETPITMAESAAISKATGARLHVKGGWTKTPNDPAVIQAIIDRVVQKQTEAVSLRVPVSDLNAAKQVAAQTGVGYQTVLKDIIHQGLKELMSALVKD